MADEVRLTDHRQNPNDASVSQWMKNWLFFRGACEKAEEADFNDSAWLKKDLPYDYCIDQPFDSRCFSKQGYLPGGTGWFRKHFSVPDMAPGEKLFVEFDGIFMESRVWCNGIPCGGRNYGYLGFEADLTPMLREGDNVLAVCCEVPMKSSRWYTGGGICRETRLVRRPQTAFRENGIIVVTKNVSPAKADVDVTAAFSGAETALLTLMLPGIAPVTATIRSGDTIPLSVPSPRLWSPDAPELYQLTCLLQTDRSCDRKTVVFGIRTVAFTMEDGLHLNGRRIPLRGICEHHDLGPLGAAFHPDAARRKLLKLKKIGCNAIRTVHNPPAPQLLDLCDELGFMVMDECFDGWLIPHTEFDYHRFFESEAETDLAYFVCRDRNHPSVILWSIGNEVFEQTSPSGGNVSARLAEVVRRHDRTRPVTAAFNDPGAAEKNGLLAPLDVVGLNYSPAFYDVFHGKYILFGSETTATLSSRDEFSFIVRKDRLDIRIRRDDQVTAYGIECMGGALPPEESVAVQKRAFWSAGEFVWCGFDYIGEPFHNGDWSGHWWPARSSYWGLIDLAGFEKDRYFFYAAEWTESPMVHLLPHWTFPELDGERVPVWCFSNCEEIELFLNGESCGIRRKQDLLRGHYEWLVPYVPGELRAEARNHGKTEAVDVRRTAGKAVRLILNAEEEVYAPGHLIFLRISCVDEQGTVVPDETHAVRVETDGPIRLLGLCNGNPASLEVMTHFEQKLFHGRLLAVVLAETPGDFRFTARTDVHEKAELTGTIA